jgi:hypothetical protein
VPPPAQHGAKEVRARHLHRAVASLAGAIAARHVAGAKSHSARPSDGDEAYIRKAIDAGIWTRALLEEEALEYVGKHWNAIEVIALELYQREVKTLEYKGQQGRDARNCIKRQLEDGCAYVILPNETARKLL